MTATTESVTQDLPAAPPAERKTRARRKVDAVRTETAKKKAAKPARAAKEPPVEEAIKPLKPKKVKLVRDSFTIPKSEFLVLQELKARGTELKAPVKKSELLRAGIKALAAMTDTEFLLAVKAVPLLKAGRPRA